ncbi:MAG: phosphoribosylglycinamide formyltransferase [Candidatus Thiodiazotropha sp.]|jgi:phosphoribosylglycinamide formyltransferase 1
MTSPPRLAVVVLISGHGSNLQAIIDAASNGLPIDIVAVISNRPNVYGLERAAQAGIETALLQHKDFPDRDSFDQALVALIDHYTPELVILAGFMRILSADFVRHYTGRILNIHPSLLPKHRGLDTHQRALDSGDTLHGATVHFVTEELDGGPLISQAQVTVESSDNASTLAKRVLDKEHQLYPLAIRWFAQGRLKLDDSENVILDNKKIDQPIIYAPQDAIQ